MTQLGCVRLQRGHTTLAALCSIPLLWVIRGRRHLGWLRRPWTGFAERRSHRCVMPPRDGEHGSPQSDLHSPVTAGSQQPEATRCFASLERWPGQAGSSSSSRYLHPRAAAAVTAKANETAGRSGGRVPVISGVKSTRCCKSILYVAILNASHELHFPC